MWASLAGRKHLAVLTAVVVTASLARGWGPWPRAVMIPFHVSSATELFMKDAFGSERSTFGGGPGCSTACSPGRVC